MNPIRRICRVANVLAGLAGVLLALAAAAPAALASGQPPLPPLPPGWNKHPPLPVQVHTVVAGGMPGWQITLIAIGAALVAATAAVLADRARTARREPVIAR